MILRQYEMGIDLWLERRAAIFHFTLLLRNRKGRDKFSDSLLA